MQLAGRVAFVTGAGSGIGKAAALAMAREGARIAAFDILRQRAEEVSAEIAALGGEALPLSGDVSSVEDVQAAIAQIGAKWDRLDIVIANAGINGVWTSLEEMTPEEWDRIMDVNLKGTFLSVKYALPYLKRNGGAIVCVASVNGTRMFSNTGATAYACSKGGQVIFTKMTAVELAKHRIRINAICPGGVATQLSQNTWRRNLEAIRHPVEFPEGPIPLTGRTPAQPDQLGKLILFLVSDNADHITGTEMWIDGGQSLVTG
jgi:NAD(P)-dependent dehydrogenase (short-subunit alcohol dehydrogenase family)